MKDYISHKEWISEGGGKRGGGGDVIATFSSLIYTSVDHFNCYYRISNTYTHTHKEKNPEEGGEMVKGW